MQERSSGLTSFASPLDESIRERERFKALWARNLPGESAMAETIYGRLIEFYGEPHRHYHTLNHIRHCLRELDRAATLITDPDAVEMALWFHDAIYQPGAKDNERRSADLFRQWSGARADPVFQQRVDDLIMATTHQEPPDQGDAKFLVDIDLSSFGLPWETCERAPKASTQLRLAKVLGMGFEDLEQPGPADADDLRRLRETLGWTREEAARRLVIQASTLARVEAGVELPPDPRRMARVYGLTAGELAAVWRRGGDVV